MEELATALRLLRRVVCQSSGQGKTSDYKVQYWNGKIQNNKDVLINGVSQLLEDAQDEANAG